MSVCVYVCMCVDVRICVCVYVCVYVCMSRWLFMCICGYVCFYERVCMCFLCVRVYVYNRVFVNVRMCVI